MADDTEGLRLHQRLAQGLPLPEGDFGVENLTSKNAGGPVHGGKTLKDHERAAGKPINGNQANPDHGYK